MSDTTIEQLELEHGLGLAQDTGPKDLSNNYTTLVMVHGLTWHSGVFSRMLPLTESHNLRIILLNRRDYPGATPYSDEDMRLLSWSIDDAPEAAAKIKVFMEVRARELYDFLVALVKTKNIPVEGGIVLAGWSLGSVWMTAFLAHVSTFPIGDIDLHRYVRRIVLLDAPYIALGYQPSASDFGSSLHGPSPSPEASGYYKHGDSPSEFERRIHLDVPRPTIEMMTADDRTSAQYLAPGDPGGSDALLMQKGIYHGLFTYLKERMLYPVSTPHATGSDWDDVELQCIWCDQSHWVMKWASWAFQTELDEAEKVGKKTRKVTIKRVPGANHFVHWDQPELALAILL